MQTSRMAQMLLTALVLARPGAAFANAVCRDRFASDHRLVHVAGACWVLVAALATFAVWMVFGPGLAAALVAAVSVLIIACPCARGLATPVSIMVGTGRAAELGVLFRAGDALQGLQSVKVIAFDKTGTLTRGTPTLTRIIAAESIAKLQAQGIAVAMITGDVAATASHVARALDIDHVTAGVPPGGKVEAIHALRKDHGAIAFVGDGINDAPALTAADVGLAVAKASDSAMDAADMVLMSDHTDADLRARRISAATLRNIRQNLVWAFGYNVALIPVAAGLLVPFGGPQLSPSLAAGAMAPSSVFVVTNALRLRNAWAGARTSRRSQPCPACRPGPSGITRTLA